MVSGRFNQVGYGVAAFICYSDVCAFEYNNNNNNIYLLQLGCYPVAVVILYVTKHEIVY